MESEDLQSFLFWIRHCRRRPYAAAAVLHLRQHLLPLLRAASHSTTSALSSSLHRRLLLCTSASVSPTPFSVEEYLVATCGLTGAQAFKACKKLPHLSSVSNPDAVLALLSGAGLSRPDIAAVVAADPLLLRSRVGNIAHRLASLRDRVGLSDPEITRFLLAGGARALRSCDIAPKLKFWIPFFGSFDKFVRIVKLNNSFLNPDVEKVVKPNIALLRGCGLSVCDIVQLSMPCSRLRAEKLGVPRTSSIFNHAVKAACCLTEEKVAARMEFLRSTLGCSMEKIRVVVCKMPNILGLSEENLRRKIEFMVTGAGLEPDHILEWPILLTYSLEKRMVPRHYVFKILQAKELLNKGVGFLQLVNYSEKRFARIIDRHKNPVPGLADAYAAARAGEMPAKAHL